MGGQRAIEKILGVDRDLLEQFLQLIVEKNPQVDKANYFLEIQAHVSGINVGITNQRDVLSHLVTLLTHPDRHREEHQAQITAAEEHYRRAILESYEQALNIQVKTTYQLITAYKSRVAPLLNPGPPGFADAPTVEYIDNVLREIHACREIGRGTKARNRWDSEWEAGVQKLIEGFTRARELTSILEKYVNLAEHHHDKRKDRRIALLGIAVGVLSVFVTVLFALLLKK